MLQVIFILIVIGVLLWLVNTYIPMDAKIKRIINIVIVVLVVLWLLNIFGVFALLNNGPGVPRIHR